MFRWISQAGVVMLLAAALGGCALWPFGGDDDDYGAFGDPQAARLLMARGWADYATEPISERGDAWRSAACRAEDRARQSLSQQIRQNLKSAWAQAELRSGNELPSLRQSDLDTMINDILDRAHLVSRGDPEYGTTEAFAGVRLSGELSQCLSESPVDEVGSLCARSPEMDSLPRCDELSPPELLYYLEDA